MDNYKKLLIFIFLLSLSLRIYFSFQIPNYNYESYFDIRQITHITNNGWPIFSDDLSYQGRTITFSPLYHYVLAFFNLFLPEFIVFKIIPNVFASTIVIISYLISYRITGSKKISLLTSFISAFVPRYMSETINSLSIYSLVIPLTFLMLYFLLNLENKRYCYYFIVSAFLLSILHPSSLIFVLGLIIYTIILLLEDIKQERLELEAMLFSIFLIIWVQFLIYKKDFLIYGTGLIWQNIPNTVLSQYFTEISILGAIVSIGLIPLISGIYTIYKLLFRAKNKDMYLLISFALAITLLLYLKLIAFKVGLMFLGIILTLLFSQSYKFFEIYIVRTRFSKYITHLFIFTIIMFMITTVVPSFYIAQSKINDAPTQEEIDAMKWIEQNTPKDSTILAPLKYGFLINFFAERKNIVDQNFLTSKDPPQRLEDIRIIYTTKYKTDVLGLLSKYSANYLLISEKIKREFNIINVDYTEDSECFKLVYNSEIDVYKSLCAIGEI